MVNENPHDAPEVDEPIDPEDEDESVPPSQPPLDQGESEEEEVPSRNNDEQS